MVSPSTPRVRAPISEALLSDADPSVSGCGDRHRLCQWASRHPVCDGVEDCRWRRAKGFQDLAGGLDKDCLRRLSQNLGVRDPANGKQFVTQELSGIQDVRIRVAGRRHGVATAVSIPETVIDLRRLRARACRERSDSAALEMHGMWDA